tara:strand:- start:195 stop:698 length:504 start_codon:yes stop_codon:yes gene_type:complete
MAAITVTNEANTVIDAVVTQLLAATISSVSVFDRCEKANSVDLFKETRLSGHGSAAVVGVINVGIEEFIITDDRIGNVVSLTLLLANQKKTDVDRTTEIHRLISAAKNTINGNRPGTSEGFYVLDAEEIIPQIAWGEPDIDSDSNKSWVFAELPLSIAFVTTNDTSH